MCFCYFSIHSKPAVILKSCYFATINSRWRAILLLIFCYFVVMVLEVVLICYLTYSRKYWLALNLAVEPKIAIARILADLNLAVRYGIAIHVL